jgi:DNA-binding NtrC family response regulator
LYPVRTAMNPIEVLFIEDSAGDALLMRRILSDLSVSVNLRLARDAKQARIILDNKSYQPGLIILDLNIAGISGFALLEEFQSRNIPVVVFSASSNQADVERSLALGAREFVRKPSDIEVYRDIVRQMIEKWAVPRGEND